MRTSTRLTLALVIFLLLGGLIGLGRWQRHEDTAPAAGGKSAATCRECHADVWNEWAASYHSRAYADANVQAAFQHFGFDRKCESCHAPQPVLVTGLSAPPELRAEDRSSGVNCLTCHSTPDGQGVAAVRTIAGAPCRPVQTPDLESSRLCGVCHTAIAKDWQESRYGREGKSCRDCHVPSLADGNSRRSHLFLGGHHEATVRSGADLRCRQQGKELVVWVTNHATGHNFPGERHNRLLLVQVIQRNPAGQITLARQALIKGITPFRGETSDEKIRAGETFEARFPVVEPGTADVRLLYKLFPFVSDRDAQVVHRQELKLEKP